MEQQIDTYNLFDDDILNAAYRRRDEWAASDKKRDEGISLPTGVGKILDIAYGTSLTDKEAVWHTLDIYYPEEQKQRYPVIVSVHGGGWFYGTKELYRPYCMTLASYGFAVVNFNYRRSPEYKYPAAFLDVCCIMDFVCKNSEKYHFDLGHVFMVGDSAGAQLTTQYCVYTANSTYRQLVTEALSREPADLSGYQTPVPQAVALNCGVYNMWDILDQDVTKWYLPQTDNSLLIQSFTDILKYIDSHFPSTYLMTSVNDELMRHTAPMKVALDAHRVPNIYREYGENDPADGHVFHLNLRSADGILCNQEECGFFAKF